MILVTGATGLVGAHLALKLAEKGLNITAIHQEHDPIQKTKDLFIMYDKEHLFDHINWIIGDITDIPSLEIAFKNIEYVYHCAGKVSFSPSEEAQLRKINIEGTANIVNFCLAKNVKKACFVSSIAALGNITPNNSRDLNSNEPILIDEETEWNSERPNTDYAISKYGAEMEIWRGQQEGLQVVIVNPGIILGPIPKSWNRDEGSFRLINKVFNGMKDYTLGVTGYVGVNDVVTCMIELMTKNYSGNRYILVSENLSYKSIISLIAEKLKVPKPKKEVKSWMTDFAWRLDWVKANLLFQKRNFSQANANSLHIKDTYSSEKVKTQLNFTFEPMEKVIQEIAEKF